MSEETEVSETKKRVLQRIQERKRMISTAIICIAVAIISVLLLVLIKLEILNLSVLGSFLLAGFIRVLFLVIFFTTVVIGIANIREYYVYNASGLFDLISVLVATLLLAYFLFDFPNTIADTLTTLGGCSLVMVYFYLVQD